MSWNNHYKLWNKEAEDSLNEQLKTMNLPAESSADDRATKWRRKDGKLSTSKRRYLSVVLILILKNIEMQL